jgi:hypothetical protein
VNPSETTPNRWQVTTASHTSTASYYLVIQESSNSAVKVIIVGRKRRYVWNDTARAKTKEKVSDLERKEIDKALVRYLTE